MSESEEKPVVPQLGFDSSLTDRFQKLNYDDDDNNKPDFKQFDLGSPISPLKTRLSGSGSGITPTSSSSSSSGSFCGKTGNNNNNRNTVAKRSNGGSGSGSGSGGGGGGGNNHSGELSVSSENSPTAAESVRSVPGSTRNYRPSHNRSYSGSGPLIYSGGGGGGGGSGSSSGSNGGVGGGAASSIGSSATSPITNALPAGNICPSGKILRPGITCKSSSRSDILGSGRGNYGIGSIVRGGGVVGKSSPESSIKTKKVISSFDPEELKRAGNEEYKRGNFSEALYYYDRAISILPGNAVCHGNRAAALTGLRRLGEAIRECEEAIRLDPGYIRAHQRLASLHLRLGQVEKARTHLCYLGQQTDPFELSKIQEVEKHLSKCANSRKIGDWKSAMREADAAIAAGADSSPALFACRTEALLKLHQLEEAETSLSKIPKFTPCSETKLFGMLAECYIFFVRAQVEMSFGRFENAISAAEKAGQIDPRNVEVLMMLKNVRLVSKARSHGNYLFKSGMYAEACSAYDEGLKIDATNSILYCNRAACWSKLGQWEKSVEDCNTALRFQPNYTKALLRRAASNSKLERWVETVRDYEVLRRQLPGDNEVAEALFHAQVALKKSRGEEVYNMKFGGGVEEILDLDQFRAVISSPSVSVVHFKSASNKQSLQISPFVDTLCVRFPSVNFLKVDIEESPAVAKVESVGTVPTFKIYKNGRRVKELIYPDNGVLENWVRHYSL